MRQLLFAAIFFASPSVLADMKSCDSYAKFSRSVMEGRQNGFPMRQAMEVANSEALDDDLRDLARKIVIAAYEESGYETESMKNKAIVDFENKVYMTCIKMVR